MLTNFITCVTGFLQTPAGGYFGFQPGQTPALLRGGEGSFTMAVLFALSSQDSDAAGEAVVLGCGTSDPTGWQLSIDRSSMGEYEFLAGTMELSGQLAANAKDFLFVVAEVINGGEDLLSGRLFINGVEVATGSAAEWVAADASVEFAVGNGQETPTVSGLMDGAVAAFAIGPVGADIEALVDAVWSEVIESGDILDLANNFTNVWSCRRGLTNVVDNGNETWVDWKAGEVLSRLGTQVGLSVEARDGSDAAFAVVGGGGGPTPPVSTLLDAYVYVAKNGNDTGADGSVSKPFLTVQAAMQYAWTTYVLPHNPQGASPFYRATVYVCPGTYDDGALVLPPDVCVAGSGGDFCRIIGIWSVDDRWAAPGNVFVSGFQDIGLESFLSIDWDPIDVAEGTLRFVRARFGSNVGIQSRIVGNPNTKAYFQSCEHQPGTFLTLVGGHTVINDAMCPLATDGGLGATLACYENEGVTTVQTWGGTWGQVALGIVDAPFIHPINVWLGHSAQPDAELVVNNPMVTVYVNANARPLPGLITLDNGATLAQVIDTNP